MDNFSAPTHADFRVHVPGGLFNSTRHIDLGDVQAIRVRHCKSNDRNSDHTIFIKGQEPERVDIGAAITAKIWRGFDGRHTLDMMKKAGAADDIVAIPETNYRHKGRIYDSRTLFIHSSAIEEIVPNPKAPETESLVKRVGGGAPIRVLAPVKDLAEHPRLARYALRAAKSAPALSL